MKKQLWRLVRLSGGVGACALVAYASYQPRGRGQSVVIELRPDENTAAPLLTIAQGGGTSAPRAPAVPATAGAPAATEGVQIGAPKTKPLALPVSNQQVAKVAASDMSLSIINQAPIHQLQGGENEAAQQAKAAAQRSEAAAYAEPSPQRFQAAASALEEAIRHQPGDITLRKSAGYLWLEKLSQSERAVVHLEHAAGADPEWEPLLAKAYEQTGKIEAAISVHREIVKRDPKAVWNWIAIAKLQAKTGRQAEAAQGFIVARQMAPDDPDVAISYAEFLAASGQRKQAKELVRQVIDKHPDSKWGQGLLGDLYRADAEYDLARQAYEAAIRLDRNWYAANAGLLALDRSREPRFSSTFYRFRDTKQLDQMGVFNTLSLGVADQLTLHSSANVRWFDTPDVSAVHRLEESLVLDYRLNSEWTVQGGITGFQTEGSGRDEVGGVAAIYWANAPFNAYINGRLNEPVNDSIVTAMEGYTQDVVAAGVGWQVTDRFSLTASGSTARYSDNNDRRHFTAEATLLLVPTWNLSSRLQYEMIDFDESRTEYSSPEQYQYVRPILEAKPKLTPWATLNLRFELPYVVDEREWGTGFHVGPEFQIGEHFTLELSYFRYDLPDGFANYSGEGFRIGLRLRP